MKRLTYCVLIASVAFVTLAIFKPISELAWAIFRNFFLKLEMFSYDFKNTFQAITSLGILSIPITWWYQNKQKHEKIIRNLTSISIVSVSSDAIADIKNTSTVDGSSLQIKIYKPKDQEFLKCVANSEDIYRSKKDLLLNPDYVLWESAPSMDVSLSIGEIAQFHLKDIQEQRGGCPFCANKDNNERPIGR